MHYVPRSFSVALAVVFLSLGFLQTQPTDPSFRVKSIDEVQSETIAVADLNNDRKPDIIAIAKSKPGAVTFASGGSGTSHHLSGVLFGRATGTNLVHVPYRSAPQAVLAVMSNQVTTGFFNIPLVIGQIRDGRLRALGVTSLERSPLLPSVPTLDEQGIKGYEVDAWGGFVAPAGTAPEIVDRLNAELIKIFASAETKQTLEPQGFDLSPPLTPAAFAKLISDDLTYWIPVVKASRAKAD